MRCSRSALVLLLVGLGGAGTRLAAHADATGTVWGRLGPPVPPNAVVWLEGVPASAWSVPRSRVAISQRGARFQPDFVVVVAGQTVAMPNDDRITHNVFSVSPAKRFDLGHYRQGEVRTVVFDRAGVIDLFCNIHENMHATIVVVPSTFYAVADAEGRYSITDVPPGSYRILAYSPQAGQTSVSVTVAAGARVERNLQPAPR